MNANTSVVRGNKSIDTSAHVCVATENEKKKTVSSDILMGINFSLIFFKLNEFIKQSNELCYN